MAKDNEAWDPKDPNYRAGAAAEAAKIKAEEVRRETERQAAEKEVQRRQTGQ